MTSTWNLPTGLTAPISLNDRDHWAVKARKTRMVREAIHLSAKAMKVPNVEHIHAVLEYYPRDRRRRDPDNLWATAKPAVDGLVDAGVIPDDTAEYVTRHSPVIHEADPRRAGCRIWLKVWL